MKNWANNELFSWEAISKALNEFESNPVIGCDVNTIPELQPIAEHLAYVIDKNIANASNPFDRALASHAVKCLCKSYPTFMNLYVEYAEPVCHAIVDDSWDSNPAAQELIERDFDGAESISDADWFAFVMHYFV